MNSFTKLGTCFSLLGLIDDTATHLYAIISSGGVLNSIKPQKIRFSFLETAFAVVSEEISYPIKVIDFRRN